MDWNVANELRLVAQSTIVFVTLVLYYYYFYSDGLQSNRGSHSSILLTKSKNSTVSSCKNPDCIRCQRYRYVKERAQSKLCWILRDLKARDPSTFSKLNKRIPDAIQRGNHLLGNGKTYASSLQDPNILMVPDLPSKELVTDWHQNACDYLKQHQTRTIVNKALHSLANDSVCGSLAVDDSKWTINDSPQGEWRVFQILNQGVWNPMLLCEERDVGNSKKACQSLYELVRDIPDLLNNSLFGNAFVSKIYPGTNIEPHCGPTNVRHRLQFLLKLPENPSSSDSMGIRNDTRKCDLDSTPTLSMSVGREKNISWNMHKDTFVFDDSFVHSVAYRDEGRTTDSIDNPPEKVQTIESLARIVLVIDLWHPHLQGVEKKLIQDLYPPYTSHM